MSRVSATRLLVLGCLRTIGPMNGYQVRRELVSWRIEETTNVKPGSIYSALRTLEKDGLVTDDEGVYSVTGEGEKEFQLLLRETWWRLVPPAEPLVPALTMLPHMPRAELRKALAARAGALKAELEQIAFNRGQVEDGATGADGGIPEHVREIFDFLSARRKSELEWTIKLQHRLRAGVYELKDD